MKVKSAALLLMLSESTYASLAHHRQRFIGLDDNAMTSLENQPVENDIIGFALAHDKAIQNAG